MAGRKDPRRLGDRYFEVLQARAEEHWTESRILALFGNRKNLILPPVEAAPLLRALGLLNSDASMSPDAVRKYMQINHMVALLEPLFLHLIANHDLVRVIDAGCGSSFLTELLAWCFRNRWHHEARILGIDRNGDVITRCRERAAMTKLDDILRFEACTLEELDLERTWRDAFDEPAAEVSSHIHALLALHACDTATDDALAIGIALDAELIAVAPCCQAELAGAWAELPAGAPDAAFAPIWNSPHLRREAGATLTDALRALLLQGCGYAVTAMEFVPSPHTPKNTLLRATRRTVPAKQGFERYLALRDAVGGVDIRLATALPKSHGERLRELSAAGAQGITD